VSDVDEAIDCYCRIVDGTGCGTGVVACAGAVSDSCFCSTSDCAIDERNGIDPRHAAEEIAIDVECLMEAIDFDSELDGDDPPAPTSLKQLQTHDVCVTKTSREELTIE
jgi:hypothetical protein